MTHAAESLFAPGLETPDSANWVLARSAAVPCVPGGNVTLAPAMFSSCRQYIWIE